MKEAAPPKESRILNYRKSTSDHASAMRRMDYWIRYYDTHEHWFLRELRWKAEGSDHDER